MSDETGPADPTADQAFARPDGLDAPFAPRPATPAYAPPPPMVSPDEQAAFGRPAGAGGFAPPPEQRLGPRPTERPPVPEMLGDAFGAPAGARDGFDPPPGTRIDPRGRAPESPWWKPDAAVDPWRDPSAPYWLGRGAVFTGSRPAQLDPDEDVETDPDAPVLPPEQPEAPAEMSRRLRLAQLGRSALFVMIIGALLAGAVGGGIGYWVAQRGNRLLHREVSLSKTGQPANRPPGSVADIARRIGPAVVSVAITTSTEYALGSGVVIDKNGYVLTNNHVVADAANGAGTIIVTFSDEATAKATIVGRDPTSDLAVLKVPNTSLTVAALGDSSKLAVGDPVIAIGSPLGLQGTVTEGIVSALNRAVHIDDAQAADGVYLDAIQTDAAINHGNSGGALVDASGAVVGINSAAALGSTDASGQGSSTSGIGFAIPMNYARDIAQQLIAHGKAVHAALGAQGRSATAGSGLLQGAYLVQVAPGAAADKAGLRNGDVIVVADGRPVVTYDQLVVAVQEHKPGEHMNVTYYRGAAKLTASITLGSA